MRRKLRLLLRRGGLFDKFSLIYNCKRKILSIIKHSRLGDNPETENMKKKNSNKHEGQPVASLKIAKIYSY